MQLPEVLSYYTETLKESTRYLPQSYCLLVPQSHKQHRILSLVISYNCVKDSIADDITHWLKDKQTSISKQLKTSNSIAFIVPKGTIQVPWVENTSIRLTCDGLCLLQYHPARNDGSNFAILITLY